MPQHHNETTIDDNGEDYTVRIRFRLPKDKLNIESSEIALGFIGKDKAVTLKSIDGETKISEAEWLVLKSEGWSDEVEAQSGAELLVDILCKSLAANNLGADLGRRTPGGSFFRAFLNSIEQKTGKVVLNDERGPMVYKTSLNPLVATVNAISAHIKVNQERFVTSFSKALKQGERYTAKERMAFDLFSMAHGSAQSADARFVLHFAALETLIEPIERPTSSKEHVEQLIELTTKNSDLSDEEMKSMIGTLKWLKNHSIRSAGRQFVEKRLGDAEINGRTPVDIFLESYDMRNRLVHGQKDLADWREVSNLVSPLEQILSLLLAKESKL